VRKQNYNVVRQLHAAFAISGRNWNTVWTPNDATTVRKQNYNVVRQLHAAFAISGRNWNTVWTPNDA
ncbi:hypothetical protein CTI14_72465, partial [Methylobacterium radiotolerans]